MMLRVPVGAMVVTVAFRSGIDALPEQGKRAADFGQARTGLVPLGLDQIHDLMGQIHTPGAVVGNPQTQEHVPKAHDAQSDFSGSQSGFGNLGQGVAVDIDDIIQKMHGAVNGLDEMLLIQRPAVLRPAQMRSQVDRT